MRASAAVTVDLPDAGNPVIQTAKPSPALDFAVVVDFVWVECVIVKNIPYEGKNPPAEFLRKVRVPDRTGDHQSSESEKGCHDRKHFPVTGVFEIPGPETLEQNLEISLQSTASLKREEEIVDGQSTHFVSRLTPFSPRAVQDTELGSVLEQDIPRVEVAMDLT